jgi:glycosyltransferase involved in cell wall biosynthesis
MKYDSWSIAVGIPAYNEHATLGPVISKTIANVNHVIVGNDGSTDRTAQIAIENGAVLVEHDKNEGYGSILKTIFKKAIHLDVDILITMDGDGQHNPEDLPDLIKPILNGEADIVIGSRFQNQDSVKNIPFLRRLAIQMITWIINNTTDYNLTDSQSGYRAYNRRALSSLDLLEKKMGASLEILFQADISNLKIVETPTIIRYSENHESYNFILQGHELLSSVIKYIPEVAPKRTSGSFGLNTVFVSFLVWFARLLD